VSDSKKLKALAAIARHCWRGTHWVRARGEHPRHVKEPLKFPHLERHLGEGPYIGLAPIVPGESTTCVAVLDFDSHKGEVAWGEMLALASTVRESLSLQLLAPLMFRSSGGQGIHIICLWDEPQDAYSVRELLARTLAECGLRNGTKGVKHGEVEIFPKQDAVELDGFGSMFVLPFAGQSEYLNGEVPAQWPKSRAVPALTRALATEHPYSRIDPASHSTSLADIRSALDAIPNDGAESLDYDSWRNVIFAIHHATSGSPEGLALAHEFSSRSAKYEPTFLDERVWPYVRTERTGNVITERTLFSIAAKHGYVEDVTGGFEDLDANAEKVAVADEMLAFSKLSAPALKFPFVADSVFVNRAPPSWIIRGVIPDSDLVLIIGPSGCGKSFLALDMAGAVALDQPWRGRRVRAGRVGYIAAEGSGGFRNRLLAYTRSRALPDGKVGLAVLPDAPNLMQKEDVRQVIMAAQQLGRLDVLFVDTLAQVTPGMNENAGEDVGRVLGHCKALRKHTGATIVLVHHTGKEVDRGARGWSGLKAAADAEITVNADQFGRRAVITKMKDGIDNVELPFKLNVVEIGRDEADEAIDSCVVEHLETSQARKEPNGEVQRLVWRAAHDLVLLGDDSVPMAALIENAVSQMAHDPARRDRRREIATRAVQQLAEGRFLSVDNGNVRVLT
jgi:hypothetical protein